MSKFYIEDPDVIEPVPVLIEKAKRLDLVIAHCEDTIRQAGAVRPGLASGNAHKVLQIAKGERDAN